MKKIIDGFKIAKKIEKRIEKTTKTLAKKKIKPLLAVILVGNDKPSQTYVNKKRLLAKKLGIDFKLHKFKTDIQEKEIIKNIKKIQENNKISGLIIQLPMPPHINREKILKTIKAEIDVDVLNPITQKKLKSGKLEILPPTPGAIIEILKELKVDLKKQTFCLVGTGILVGTPLSYILKNLKVKKLNLCNSKTKNIKQKTLTADVIITAVGKKNLITADMVKPDAIVIDAGTCFYKKSAYGDVDFKNVAPKIKYITPVPGGVGPITVAKLIENTVLYAKKNNSHPNL